MQEFLYDFFLISLAPGLLALLCGVIGYYLTRLTKLGRFQYVYWTLAMLLGFFLPVIAHALGIHMAETYVDTPTPPLARFLCVTIPFSLFLLLGGMAWGSGFTQKKLPSQDKPVDPGSSEKE